MTSVLPCPLPAAGAPLVPDAAPGSTGPGSGSAEEFASTIDQALAALTGLPSGAVNDTGENPPAATDAGVAETTDADTADLVAALFPAGLPLPGNTAPRALTVVVPPSPTNPSAATTGATTLQGPATALPGYGDSVFATGATDPLPGGPNKLAGPESPSAQALRPQTVGEAPQGTPVPGRTPTSTDGSAAPEASASTHAALSSAPGAPADASPSERTGADGGSSGNGTGGNGTGGQPASTLPPALHTPLAAGPVAGPTALGSAPPADAPVVAQVVPALTDLVQRGNGSHRITLELAPAALGEVRVVMTVRDGVVHVQLAAGEAARRTLREGSPELTRMLEQIGATEARVVLRELPSGVGSGAAGHLDQGGPGTESGQPHTGDPHAGDPHASHAGTRAPTPARDGPNPLHPRSSGASLPDPNDPVTRPRLAGVDVTM